MASIIINEKQLERLIGKVKTNINEGGNHDNSRYMFLVIWNK